MAAVPVLLRMLAMAGKFALLLSLARKFTPGQVGVFGLFSTVVTFTIYVVGLEYYVYTNRLLSRSTRAERAELLAGQCLLSGILLFVVCLLLSTIPALYGLVPRVLLPFLLATCVFEYLGQEIYRMLIAFDRQKTASVVLFLRSGAWCLLAAGIYFSGSGGFEWLFGFWVACGGLAVMLGIGSLFRDIDWRAFWNMPAPSALRRGLAVSLPFLVLSLSLRSVEYVDRFFINAHQGKEALGIYTYYWGLASVIQSLVVVGVINVSFPHLVNVLPDAAAERSRLYRKLVRKVLLIGPGIGAAIWFFGHLAAAHFGRSEYLGHDGLFSLLLVASYVSALAQVPQLYLYSQGRDRTIVLGGLGAATVSIFLNSILVPEMGELGAALAYLAGGACMGGYYFYFAQRLEGAVPRHP